MSLSRIQKDIPERSTERPIKPWLQTETHLPAWLVAPAPARPLARAPQQLQRLTPSLCPQEVLALVDPTAPDPVDMIRLLNPQNPLAAVPTS